MSSEPNIKCHRCDYEWKTISKMALVNCPCCGRKVVNLKNYKPEKKRSI